MGKTHKPLWIALTSVFGVLTVAMIVGTVIAFHYEPVVNSVLKINTNSTTGTTGKNYFTCDYKTSADTAAAGRTLVEEVEGEGATLLLNKNSALPLTKGSKVTALGKTSEDIIISGGGSSSMSASKAPTLQEALTSAGLEVNQTLVDFYHSGAGSSYKRKLQDGALNGVIKDNSTSLVNEVPQSAYTNTEWDSLKTYGDAAILMVGRIGGEGGDLPWFNSGDGNGNQLSLTTEEKALFAKTKALKDSGVVKKIIVVLNMSNPIQLDFLRSDLCGVDYGVDACLWIGEPGLCGLNSVGKILSGDINPSGRLPDTYCYDNLTSPAMQNSYVSAYRNADTAGLTYGGLYNKYYEVYQEGVYVGYRYYETRYADKVFQNPNVGSFDYDATVAFPFGFGLSYSSFAYSNFALKSETADAFTFTVTVKNETAIAAKNTLEVYLQSPYTDYDKTNGIEKSAIELAGFSKISLAANETKTGAEIVVSKDCLKAYDANEAKTYIKDAGDYYFALGNGAHDALNNILMAKANAGDVSLGKVDTAKMVGSAQADLTFKHTEATLDKTSFATAKSGVSITNQFDHADLNKVDTDASNDVHYVSRSDWQGTMPKATITAKTYEAAFVLSANESIAAALKTTFVAATSTFKTPTMGKDNGLKLAQFIGVKPTQTITSDGKSYSWDDLLDQVTYAQMARLVATGFHNTGNVKSVAKPATKDENGAQGFTATLTGGESATSYPSEDIRAATWNVTLYEKVGVGMGNDALSSPAKYSGLYGPNANLHRTPYGGRNFEYYSEDPLLSGKALANEVKGLQSKGVYTYMKHFALNDQETGRDGISVWASEQSIRQIYLKPFQMAIEESGAHCVMTSFNRIGAIWAGGDKNLLTNVLKGEFGMDGMAITDFSNNNPFMDVLQGLAAGSDIWDCSSTVWNDALTAKKDDPEISTYLREATRRILYTVANSNAMNGIGVDTVVDESTPWWKTTLITIDSVFGAALLAFGGLLFYSILKQRKDSA